MFTERMLRKNPALVKALTGIPDDEFWKMLEQMETQLPTYEAQRLDRADRQRAGGAGREFDQPLVLRTMAVLTYLPAACAPNGCGAPVRPDAMRPLP